MAISTAYTLQNIERYIPESAFKLLTEKQIIRNKYGTNTEFPGLSNHDLNDLATRGWTVLTFHSNQPCDVQIEWHLDQTRSIDGVFIRTYEKNCIDAYIIRKHDYKQITITDQFTQCYPTKKIDEQIIKTLFQPLRDGTMSSTFSCNIQTLHQTEEIKAFFTGHEKLLPEDIRKKVFSNAPESASYIYLYIGGALLAILGIAYLAKKVLAKPQPAQR